MAGGSASSNASRLRKRVEAESASSSTSLKRARNGSAFTKCEECKKDVAVALIGFHNCSLDAKIKMNLESTVVETTSETKKKPAGEKKRAKPTDPKAKKAKNQNGKKRPLTAFFLFMEDFRKSFKAENPDSKGVAKVAKEGGEKWKSMSDEEKKQYTDRAAELKAEYIRGCEADDAVNEQEEDDATENEEANEEVKDGLKEEKDEDVKDEIKEEKDEDVKDEIKEEKDELCDEDVKGEEVADDV